MLRKIFTVAILLSCGATIAQKKDAPKSAPAAPAEKIDYKVPGSPMHNFRLVTIDTLPPVAVQKKHKKHHKKDVVDTTFKQQITKEYTEKDFDNNANLFVMIFNPTCGHCEEQTDHIEKSIGIFKKSKIVLITNPVQMPYLSDFIKNHKVKNYPNITVGVDSSEYTHETYLYSALPQINIFDKNRKLIKAFAGEIAIDSLKQYAE